MADLNVPMMRFDGSLPSSYAIEQAILKSFFADPYLVKAFADHLATHDFFHPAHAQIISCMLDLINAGKVPEKDLVFSYLENRSQRQALESAQYLASLAPIEAEDSYDLIEQKLSYLRNLSLMRRVIQTSQSIVQQTMQTSPEDLSDLMQFIQKSYTDLSSSLVYRGPIPLADAIRETLEQLERVWLQGQATGVPSGFQELDQLTSGLQRSDFIILAARPAMGKTAFALNIARNVGLFNSSQRNVIFFSLEMSRSQITQRLLSMIGGFNSVNFRNSQFSDNEKKRLNEVASRISVHNVHIDDTSGLSVFELMARARSFSRQMGRCDLIIIDYLQLMNAGLRGRASIINREQEIRLISSNLKSLAKELDCPVIALSQLNRSLEQRPDKRPKPSDLRESGALEQDADLILFLYRDEVYNKETEYKDIAELIVSKNRHGPLKTIYLKFSPEIMNFGDLPSKLIDELCKKNNKVNFSF